VTAAAGGIVKMWKPENGRKADRVRDAIQAWEEAEEVTHHEAMVLTACLLFALDKVDSSVGVQQAYLKNWAARASNTLALEDLPCAAGQPAGEHLVGDALKLEYPAASVAYLDPPYSAHSYATYYHIWDSITRWDKPAVGLKTNRRIDRVSGAAEFDPSMQSPWNSKKGALPAFLALVARLPVKFVCISYNDESLVPLETLEGALKEAYGATAVKKHLIPYKRNIMCQIGNAAAEGGVAAEGGAGAKTENHEVLLWVAK
jgi:adenine-specific DNA-methyltransferase